MRVVHADQYNTPCVVIEPGESADQIIAACRQHGAIYHEEGPEDEVFVVDFVRGVGPEIYTEGALRGSLPAVQSKLEPGDAPGPADRISYLHEGDGQ